MLQRIVLLPMLLLAQPAAALDVAPTTLTLSQGQARTELWLHNPGPRTWQGRVRVLAWEQTQQAEHLHESGDILVSPSTLDLPAGMRQRIWLLPAPAAATSTAPSGERAFRVLLEPSSADLPRYSLPLFRTWSAGTQPCLRIRVEVAGSTTNLLLENTGNLHARLNDLVFEAADGQRELLLPGLAGYVLAGRQRHWPLPARADAYTGGRFQAQLQDGLVHELAPSAEHIAVESAGTL